MLEAALTILCLFMMLGFSHHWVRVTKEMAEVRREERIKAALDWKSLRRNPALGNASPGSALRGY